MKNALTKRLNEKIILENQLGEINVPFFLSTTALGSKVQQEQTAGEKRVRPRSWGIREGHHWRMTTEVPGGACLVIRVTLT